MRLILIANEDDVKVRLSPATVGHFWKEHEKIALTGSQENIGIGLGGVGATAGVGASYAGMAPKRVETGAGDIIIYYSDPKRGAGHKAQAEALAAELTQRGEKVRLVDFDTTYGDPERLAHYNKSFGEYLRGKKPFALHFADAHLPFYRNLNEKALLADTGGKRIVLANVGLQSWAGDVIKRPMFLLHTDQAPWEGGWVDSAVPGQGRANIHIAPDTAVDELSKVHPSMKDRIRPIHGLPIKAPKVPEKQSWGEKLKGLLRPSKAKGPFRNPGKINITASGGALGLNTPDMARGLLNNPDLAPGTVIHAVAGRGENVAELEALEAATRGKRVQVRAYGFAPLREMMQAADINVLRPHGTSITEARASKKPFLLYLPGGKGRADARGMDWRNAKAIQSIYNSPVVTERTIGQATSSILSDYQPALAKAQKLGVSPTGGAPEAARAVTSATHFTSFPRTGRKWSIARGGMGVTALGALGALAYRQGAQGLALKPSKANPQVKRWQTAE